MRTNLNTDVTYCFQDQQTSCRIKRLVCFDLRTIQVGMLNLRDQKKIHIGVHKCNVFKELTHEMQQLVFHLPQPAVLCSLAIHWYEK